MISIDYLALPKHVTRVILSWHTSYDESFCFSHVLDEPFDKNGQVAERYLMDPGFFAICMQNPACVQGLQQILLLEDLTPFMLQEMLQHHAFLMSLDNPIFVQQTCIWYVALMNDDDDESMADDSDDSDDSVHS